METLSKETTEYRGIVSNVKAAELPNEVLSTFSNAPYEFEQTSSVLWDDTQQIYYHACIANRFSENYLLLCNQLEKNIKQLGSFCLTKAVLEQKGMEFPKLAGMNVKELVCMVSYHFRKAHAALQGIYRDNDLLGLTYLNWEFRWVGLGNRLKATEVKIQMVKDGRYKTDSVFEQSETFKGEPRTNGEGAMRPAQSLRANPSALPVKGSMAREMLAKEKEDERKAEFIRKVKEKMLRRADQLERKADRMDGVQIYPENKELAAMYIREDADQLREQAGKLNPDPPKPEPGTITEAEARKKLIEDAMKRGDQKALMEIPMEDSETFLKRWMDHVENEPQAPGALSAAEVRKELLRDAKSRNDQEAIKAIPVEDQDALYERWMNYLERLETGQSRKGTVPGKARAPGNGPSADTRKALREKRKKRR